MKWHRLMDGEESYSLIDKEGTADKEAELALQKPEETFENAG